MAMTFIIPGQPQGKGRPRFAKVGNFMRAYTPAETVSFEEKVRGYALREGVTRIHGPVMMTISAFRQIPISTSVKKAESMEGQFCTVKPDWDNIGKIVSDALNGVAFNDDSQVVDVRVTKMWSRSPRIEVTLKGEAA